MLRLFGCHGSGAFKAWLGKDINWQSVWSIIDVGGPAVYWRGKQRRSAGQQGYCCPCPISFTETVILKISWGFCCPHHVDFAEADILKNTRHKCLINPTQEYNILYIFKTSPYSLWKDKYNVLYNVILQNIIRHRIYFT